MIENYIFDGGTLINTIDMYMPAMIRKEKAQLYHTDPADVEQKSMICWYYRDGCLKNCWRSR